jgi:pyruvate dehydrogenase (quinone)
MRGDMRAHLSSTLASMGCSLPYAVAAKLAHPDRLVVAMLGDGAMQMNGVNELITIRHHWRSWPNPRLPILVLHNGDLNEVTWEMREMEGDAPFRPSQELPEFPYAKYAQMLGLRGIRVEEPDDVGLAWDDALVADRPTLIEAMVDPAVPLLPPHLDDAQLQQMQAAFADDHRSDAGRARAALERELATQQ